MCAKKPFGHFLFNFYEDLYTEKISTKTDIKADADTITLRSIT